MEGLILRGAYVRWEICVTESIRVIYSWKANKKNTCLPYRLCFVFALKAVSKYKARAAYILRAGGGGFSGGFFAWRL